MAEISCGVKFSRITLIVLNFIFVIFGLALFIFGIYLTASKKFDVAFFEGVKVDIIGGEAIQNTGITLIVVGIFTVLLSAFGCLGALFKDRRFLFIYLIVLVIIMVAELAAFITALVMRVKIEDTYRDNLWKIFEDAYKDNRTDVIDAIEKLEKQFECCGVNNSLDYQTLNITAPDSCYKDPDASEPYSLGCAKAIIDWIVDELPAVGGVTGATLVLEVFGLVTAIALAVALKKDSYGRINNRY